MAELELPRLTFVPKSEVEQKAAEIKERRALPPKPGDRVNFAELQAWLALLPPDAESRVTIWVYRLEPIINRQIVDPQANNNIDIIYSDFKALTEEYMISRHGGGVYKFVVKDEDKPKTQLGGFFEGKLSIPMVEYPPKLDLREVEWDNPKNKGYQRWARTQRLINENNMSVIERKEEAKETNGGVDANMLKMLLDFTAKMSEKEQNQLKRQIGAEDSLGKSMGEILIEKMKQEDPNKQAQTMVQLITAMKSMQPEVQKDNTIAAVMPMFMTLITQMQESSKQTFAMMMEMFKQSNKANENPPAEKENELEKLRAIIELSKEIKGGGGHQEKGLGESLIELGTSILPPVLGIISNIVAMNAQAKGIKPTVVDAQPTNNMTELHNSQTMTQPAVQVGAPQLNQNQLAQMLAQYQPIIMNKLSGEGWEFGAWVAEGFGDSVAAMLVKDGPDTMLEAVKSVPTFWQAVETTYGEVHLKKWLASLCNYREILKQMEAEEESEGERIQ